MPPEITQDTSYPGFGQESPICSIQPGGGWGMRLELLWGRFRRWCLRWIAPGYVKTQEARRQGTCPDCPGKRSGCNARVIDTRDLKYFSNVCGYSFPPPDPFAWRNHLYFARWGLAELVVFTLGCLIASLAVGWLAWLGTSAWIVGILSLVILLFWLEIIWFFRDPPRTIPPDPQAIVSPADGTIVELAEVEAEGFPQGRAFRIGIFLSVFNVHINRSPISGRITKLRYYPGRFLNAMKTLSARVNEQLWIDMEHAGTQMPMRVTQISGALARRIVCDLKEGQSISKGEKFGMIKLGSRTELYIPAITPFELKVKVGDKIQGGSTILMHLKT